MTTEATKWQKFVDGVNQILGQAKGGSVKQMMEELRDLSRDFYDQLTMEDRRTIRDHELTGFANVHRSANEVQELEELIKRAPRLPSDTWLYRGSDRPIPERSQAFYPVPSTVRRNIAHTFRNPLLEAFKAPEGTPGLFIEGPEGEILLPRGGRFRKDEGLLKEVPPMERQYAPYEGVKDIRDELTYFLDDAYEYEPPYKAHGGLVE